MWIIGFLLICSALTFFITFLMANNLSTKEKVKFCLGVIAFISVLTVGAYLFSEYSNI